MAKNRRKKQAEFTTIFIKRKTSRKLWKVKFKEGLRNMDEVINFLLKKYGGIRT